MARYSVHIRDKSEQVVSLKSWTWSWRSQTGIDYDAKFYPIWVCCRPLACEYKLHLYPMRCIRLCSLRLSASWDLDNNQRNQSSTAFAPLGLAGFPSSRKSTPCLWLSPFDHFHYTWTTHKKKALPDFHRTAPFLFLKCDLSISEGESDSKA